MISAEAQGRFAWVHIQLEQRKHMGPSVRVQVVPLSLTQAEWPCSIKQPTKSFVPQDRKPTQHYHICSVNDTSHKVYDLSSVPHVRRVDNYLSDIYTVPCVNSIVCITFILRKKRSSCHKICWKRRNSQNLVSCIMHSHASIQSLILLLTWCN